MGLAGGGIDGSRSRSVLFPGKSSGKKNKAGGEGPTPINLVLQGSIAVPGTQREGKKKGMEEREIENRRAGSSNHKGMGVEPWGPSA